VLDSGAPRSQSSERRKLIGADLLDLVKRCRDGDPEAWRGLLPLFQEIGRRALRSFRLGLADSEDILSETLTTLYGGGLSSFRGETVGEFIGFLKVIVRNRAIDLLKERQRWAPADSHLGPDPFDVAADVVDGECVEFLRQEVAKLKRDDRELFLMKARGLKEREIVEQTGRPPGTVSSQIARLLERLKTILGERGCA
jgi:RNA polymerase sigma factor (sigma-70 family)